MRLPRSFVWVAIGTVTVAAAVSVACSAVALGATRITQPTGNPYHVTLDAQGKPVPFTVVASGFPFRTPVFVEQCDGRPPSAPNWSATVDCDIASSQAPVYANAQGVARFDADDPSIALRPFVGQSPQQLFNCLPPNAPSPKNELPDFSNCQIRVSSGATRVTNDQVFLPIVLGAAASRSGSSSRGWMVWVSLAALAVLVAGGFVVVRRRASARTH